MPQDSMLDTLKDWLVASNPGLVTRDDLTRLESRVDELLELMDELEARLTPEDDEQSNGRDHE